MAASAEAALRAFVAASLIGGGAALVAGAEAFQTWPTSAGLGGAAAAWGAGLAIAVLVSVRRRVIWQIPAAIVLLSMLLAITWSRFDPAGHVVLSGLAPGVALLAGAGVALRQRWSWPVAFASVVGFGPLVISLAPLPPEVVVGASVLFLSNVLALLALHPSFYEAREPLS